MCCCHPLVYRTKLGFKWIQGRDCGKPWNSPGTQHVNLEIAFSGKTTYFFFNGPQWLAFFGWQWHNHQQLNMAGLCDIDILIWWRPPQRSWWRWCLAACGSRISFKRPYMAWKIWSWRRKWGNSSCYGWGLTHFLSGWRTGWVVKIDQTNIDLERYGKNNITVDHFRNFCLFFS